MIIVNFVGSLRSLFQDQLLVFCVRWIQRVCQYGPGLGRKGKVWILHLIDAATATIYTAACFIRRKKECCKCVVYFRFFGPPGKFHSHCGGGFPNDVFREMNEY